jgi:predicted transposase YbfD/YdcC
MKLKNKKRLFEEFKSIPDFRTHRHKIQYPLEEILFLTLFALLQGVSEYRAIHTWCIYNANSKIFKRIFDKRHVRVPSFSTLHMILSNVDNNALELIFREFFKKYSTYDNLAVDGKWLNGSDISGQYIEESHKAVLNILDKDKKIVVGHQLLSKDKKSEIPAMVTMLQDKSFYLKGQIFSFDALLTQVEILDLINTQENFYIAKVKGNQKLLKEKVVFTANGFRNPTYSYTSPLFETENNKSVKRFVEVFQDRSCNVVMYHNDFKNIQSIIKITKETIDLKTGVIKTKVEYLIANFKTNAKEFHDKILQHWHIETYHYYLDTLTMEDKHIAYINPFSVSILRSFTINLYQLFLNLNKGGQINKTNIGMAAIKRASMHDIDFTSELFEI